MWPLEKNAPPLGSHVFQAKFHEDRKINGAFRVLTRKNVAPPGGHGFQLTGIIFKLTINVASREKCPAPWQPCFSNVTIFELIQDIIETNLLTKFHEDWTINVASRELTRQMLTPHSARRRRTKGDHKSSP
ncbi:hypothetical protein DPMN_082261 [Dreissena polymorpha]|uniref:Uncharacterized protein n=1 Tax=Dreissena polymorpha TaxID=45954 RepID=A0A9D3Y7A7_DREPO|nr:hypothetical protein DPMN_082261 [Dreissena polymorpha]